MKKIVIAICALSAFGCGEATKPVKPIEHKKSSISLGQSGSLSHKVPASLVKDRSRKNINKDKCGISSFSRMDSTYVMDSKTGKNVPAPGGKTLSFSYEITNKPASNGCACGQATQLEVTQLENFLKESFGDSVKIIEKGIKEIHGNKLAVVRYSNNTTYGWRAIANFKSFPVTLDYKSTNSPEYIAAGDTVLNSLKHSVTDFNISGQRRLAERVEQRISSCESMAK